MKAIHILSRPIYAILALGSEVFPTILAGAFFFPNPIAAEDFGTVVISLADLMKIIGVPLATIGLVYSGFLFVTARGNEQQLEKAKTMFFWTIVGTAIIVGAVYIGSAVVNFATSLL